jgi:hypothetical protein
MKAIADHYGVCEAASRRGRRLRHPAHLLARGSAAGGARAPGARRRAR